MLNAHGLFLHQSALQTSRCHALWLSLVLTLSTQTPQVRHLDSEDCPQCRCQPQVVGPHFAYLLSNLTTNQGSMNHFSGSTVWYNTSQDSGKYTTNISLFLMKDMMKDTGGQAQEEMHRQSEVWGRGLGLLCPPWVQHPPWSSMCSSTQKHPEPP